MSRDYPNTTAGGEERAIAEYLNSKPNSAITATEVRKTLDSFNGDIAASITFLEKYANRDEAGNFTELTLEDAKQRWAQALAKTQSCHFPNEGETVSSPQFWLELYEYFLPGGRQIHALGIGRKGLSLANCYAATIEEDSIEGIFKACYQIAKTFAFGGGQGLDLSVLRPRSKVENCARFSTGAVSFGALFSNITGIIAQSGRRGACALIMDVDHPSILEFIHAKRKDLDALRYCNISVKITDEFMRAVEKDREIVLSYDTPHEKIRKPIKARVIWKEIIESACASGEPGLLFWDHIKRMSPSELYTGFEVVSSNVCLEQPADKDSACCLGSLILNRFVRNSHTPEAEFDWETFRDMVSRAVRHLDNVVEIGIDKHPLPEQRIKAVNGRRIGLGITGVADTFASLGLMYGSQKSQELLSKIQETKRDAEYLASIELAKTRGPFPVFDPDIHYEERFPSTLPRYIKEKGRKYGQRNIAISTIAPSGSISIIAQCSSGIEPIFQLEMTRIIELGGERKPFPVFHHEVLRRRNIHGEDPDRERELFPTAYGIDPLSKVKLVGIAQKYVDSAISNTTNLPKGSTPESVGRIYKAAWENKLKGITVYVDGSREGILIPVTETKDDGTVIDGSLDTTIYKFAAEGGDKFYVAVSYKGGDKKKPYQIFITNYKITENDRFIKLANDLKRYLESKGEDIQEKLSRQISRSNNSLEKITRLLSLALKVDKPIREILDVLDAHCFVGTLATRVHAILANSLDKPILRPCPVCSDGHMRRASGGCFSCEKCGATTCD